MPLFKNDDKAVADSADTRSNLPSQVRLGLASTYYNMAQALGLQRIHDLVLGPPTLSMSDGPIWLLGVKYARSTTDADTEADQAVLAAMTADFSSRIWLTYRKGFPSLGPDGLTTDSGWGCTLRTGQMLLAQGLQQHCVGRGWRRNPEQPLPEALSRLLRWFWDEGTPQHPFSIHNLCAAGKTHGVRAGQWLGPWVLCHTLEAVVQRMEPDSLNVHVHVVSQPGGAVPVIYTHSFEAFFEVGHVDETQEGSSQAPGRPPPSVIVLLPLLLGLGKVNERYIGQLQEVLQWPQSIGIVGGRPSSSLYFVGYQGNQVLYLDPHQAQQTPEHAGDPSTYWSSNIRTMPLTSIDPSLAIGFYCRALDDGMDLLQRLATLESESKGAPLVSIVVGASAPTYDWQGDDGADSKDQGNADDWEML